MYLTSDILKISKFQNYILSLKQSYPNGSVAPKYKTSSGIVTYKNNTGVPNNTIFSVTFIFTREREREREREFFVCPT